MSFKPDEPEDASHRHSSNFGGLRGLFDIAYIADNKGDIFNYMRALAAIAEHADKDELTYYRVQHKKGNRLYLKYKEKYAYLDTYLLVENSKLLPLEKEIQEITNPIRVEDFEKYRLETTAKTNLNQLLEQHVLADVMNLSEHIRPAPIMAELYNRYYDPIPNAFSETMLGMQLQGTAFQHWPDLHPAHEANAFTNRMEYIEKGLTAASARMIDAEGKFTLSFVKENKGEEYYSTLKVADFENNEPFDSKNHTELLCIDFSYNERPHSNAEDTRKNRESFMENLATLLKDTECSIEAADEFDRKHIDARNPHQYSHKLIIKGNWKKLEEAFSVLAEMVDKSPPTTVPSTKIHPSIFKLNHLQNRKN